MITNSPLRGCFSTIMQTNENPQDGLLIRRSWVRFPPGPREPRGLGGTGVPMQGYDGLLNPTEIAAISLHEVVQFGGEASWRPESGRQPAM